MKAGDRVKAVKEFLFTSSSNDGKIGTLIGLVETGSYPYKVRLEGGGIILFHKVELLEDENASFEQAVKAMESGKICKCLTNGNHYRIINRELQWETETKTYWIKSNVDLSIHMRNKWIIVEEKKTLSEKVLYTTQVTVKHTAETNFVGEDIYNRFKDPDRQKLLPFDDVKQFIEDLVGSINLLVDTDREFNNIKTKIKELAGERLI